MPSAKDETFLTNSWPDTASTFPRSIFMTWLLRVPVIGVLAYLNAGCRVDPQDILIKKGYFCPRICLGPVYVADIDIIAEGDAGNVFLTGLQDIDLAFQLCDLPDRGGRDRAAEEKENRTQYNRHRKFIFFITSPDLSAK